MTQLLVGPPNGNKAKAKASFKPPMNTDEHRLKADKEKAYKHMHCSFFIMSLSVFIGVHRCSSVFIGVHRCSSVAKNSFQ